MESILCDTATEYIQDQLSWMQTLEGMLWIFECSV